MFKPKETVGRFALAGAVAVLVLLAQTVFAATVITKVDYDAEGKATGATSMDAATGQQVPTQGTIDPATGKYTPSEAAQPAAAAGPGEEAATPAVAAEGAFTAGRFDRYQRRESRSAFEDMEEYRIRKWREIWSGPASSPR